jgi:signal transduction histidine kinase
LADITERKQSEAQAAELAAKEKVVAALRTLLDYLSHDLRTPLSVINANLFLVRRKLNDVPAVQTYVNVLEQQTARLAQMIDDVVTVSSLDNEVETFEFTYVDLNQLVSDVLKGQERSFKAKNLTLHRQLAAVLPPLRGDRIWLSKLIKNLILNAIQYTWEGGTITVITAGQPNGVIFTVTDTGSGIDPDDLPHVFEHFYRGDKTRPMNSGGSGLGLTIVKKVVEAHKGTIDVESVVGQGSTFRIHLPLRP